MGAYLNKPITKKESEVGECEGLRYSASCMQGWRVNQEDSHNCILNFSEGCSLFAVYDGHGGSEVARYTAMHLPDLLKDKESWKNGDYAKAIEEAFLEFDDILRSDEVLKELKVMAGVTSERREPSDDEDKQALYEEATMPLESILEKYGFSLRRDRSGKAVIDLENIKVFRDELEKPSQDSKWFGNFTISVHRSKAPSKIAYNLMEKGAVKNSSGINGNEKDGLKSVEEPIVEDGIVLKSAINGQVGEEKIKKRLCQSPIDGNPKLLEKEDNKEKGNGQCFSEEVVTKTSETIITSKESESNCLEKTEVCLTKEVSNTKSSSENGTEKVVTESTLKVEKSALEAELDKDVDEGTSEAINVRQVEDDDNKPQPSTALETQTTMSSDSEQSFDEDYKEEDEVSEEDEEEDDSEPDEENCYNGPSGDTPGEDSGTTACVVLLFQDKVIVGNAGDSRAVLCRKGKAIDLSVDHKPEDAAEKRRIEAAGGYISVDGRVNGGLNLSRALGDHFYKKNSKMPLKDQMISAQPDITEHKLEPDDEFIVVACDGIWNSLTSQDVVDFVRTRIASGLSLKEICEKMCDECLSPNTAGDGTGCDNMTVIIAEVLHV